MVADILMRVDTAEFQAFMDKWSIMSEDEFTLSSEQREQMEQENPLCFRFHTDFKVNENVLEEHDRCSMFYTPETDTCEQEEWAAILDYYNLDASSCWVIQRSSYSWKGSAVDIATLEAIMRHQPMFLPGIKFETNESGEAHTFHNPTTGTLHTLTVQQYEKQELGVDFPGSNEREYPNHYIIMTFTLEPELARTEFSIADSQQSDEPRGIPDQISDRISSSAESIGIIGGADGPAAIILGAPAKVGQLHAAVSGLRFESFDKVRWQLSFKEKQIQEKIVKLM